MKAITLLFILFFSTNFVFSQVQHKDTIITETEKSYSLSNFNYEDITVQIILDEPAVFYQSSTDENTFNYIPFKDVNILIQISFKNRDKSYYSEKDLKEMGEMLEKNLKKKNNYLGFSFNTAEINNHNTLYTNYISQENNKHNLFSQYLYSLHKKDVLLMCFVQTEDENELNAIIEKFLPEFQEMALTKLRIYEN